MRPMCLVGLASLLVALPVGAQPAQQTVNRQPTHSASVTTLEKQVKQLQERVGELRTQVTKLQATVRALLEQKAAKPTSNLASQLHLQEEITSMQNQQKARETEEAFLREGIQRLQKLMAGAAVDCPADSVDGATKAGAFATAAAPTGTQDWENQYLAAAAGEGVNCGIRLKKVLSDLILMLDAWTSPKPAESP